MIKKAIRKFTIRIFKLFYRQGKLEYIPISLIFKCFIVQKIIGINRSVPWPVHWTSQVKAWKNIEIGDELPGIAMGNYIDGRNGIIIKENVWIGPKVSMISQNHDNHNYTGYLNDQPIKIARDSLLATGCIILPGVELGPHTIVAAGAVVTKSFPDGNQIVGGNPALVIKKLNNYAPNADYASLNRKMNL
jgi:acetyltransferase-like isoleucine patch superfamily enzyme